MKFWRNAAALPMVFHPKTTHCGNHSTPKDVKNEGRPGYMYENKVRATKCHVKNAAFYTKTYPSHGNRQQSSGPFGRLCSNCATIRGELTPATVVALVNNGLLMDSTFRGSIWCYSCRREESLYTCPMPPDLLPGIGRAGVFADASTPHQSYSPSVFPVNCSYQKDVRRNSSAQMDCFRGFDGTTLITWLWNKHLRGA